MKLRKQVQVGGNLPPGRQVGGWDRCRIRCRRGGGGCDWTSWPFLAPLAACGRPLHTSLATPAAGHLSKVQRSNKNIVRNVLWKSSVTSNERLARISLISLSHRQIGSHTFALWRNPHVMAVRNARIRTMCVNHHHSNTEEIRVWGLVWRHDLYSVLRQKEKFYHPDDARILFMISFTFVQRNLH